MLRALCPFHGSDHQRSLRVTQASGRFVCCACGAWGYLAEARVCWQEERPRQAAFQRPAARVQRAQRPRPPAPREPAPARPDLAQHLAAFQTALPGSRGEGYLPTFQGRYPRLLDVTNANFYHVSYERQGKIQPERCWWVLGGGKHMSSKEIVEVIYGKSHKYEIVKSPGGFLSSTSFSIYRDGKYFKGAYSSLSSAVEAAKQAG